MKSQQQNFVGQLCVGLMLALGAGTGVMHAPPQSTRGVVEGVQDCGSRGSVYQVRVEGCERTPCQLLPDNIYEIEVDFSTGTRGDLWNVVVTGTAGNTSVVVLDEIVEASIEPGERHTLHYELPVTTLFEGFDIQVKVQLIEHANQVEEVCISADAHVNETPPTTTAATNGQAHVS